MSKSISEHAQRQAAMLASTAKFLETHGYALVIHANRADSIDDERFLYSYFSGALSDWIRTWAQKQGCRYLVISVFPHPKDGQKRLAGELNFKLRVPIRVPYRPIIMALKLVCGGHQTERRGVHGLKDGITYYKASDYYEFSGKDRDALRTLLCVLEYPHHREILVAKTKQPRD